MTDGTDIVRTLLLVPSNACGTKPPLNLNLNLDLILTDAGGEVRADVAAERSDVDGEGAESEKPESGGDKGEAEWCDETLIK